MRKRVMPITRSQFPVALRSLSARATMALVGRLLLHTAVGMVASSQVHASSSLSLRPFEVPSPALPPLGNDSRYLPTEDLTIRLVLRVGERRVYVYRGEQEVLASYPVAVGHPDTPTPTGQFEVFQMIVDPVWQSPWTGEVHQPGPNSALGLRWIGFAELSNGIVGFHGTPTVSSIGKAASNGCIRMYNEDVVALFEQVEIGTLVVVEP